MNFQGSIGIEDTTDRYADLDSLNDITRSNMTFFVDNGEVILSSSDLNYKVYRRADMLIPFKSNYDISVLNSLIMVNEEPVIKSSTLSTFSSNVLLSSTIQYVQTNPYAALVVSRFLPPGRPPMILAYRDSI